PPFSPVLVSVALPVALYQPLTYSVPDDLVERVNVGSRVIVPLRQRRQLGFVVGEGQRRDGVPLKPILGAPDDQPVLDAPLLKLCMWIAEYYVAPLGVVLRTALPAALTGVDSPHPAQKT